MTSKDSKSDDNREAQKPLLTLPGPAILEPHESLRYVGKLFKALAVGLFPAAARGGRAGPRAGRGAGAPAQSR